MNSTTCEMTKAKFRELFGRFGIPGKVVSDNGTQFCANEMDIYFKKHGIEHCKTAPGHPASNGEAENMVKSFKSSLKTVLDSCKRGDRKFDIDLALQRFLLDYRTTKHCTTQETPAKLMFGRELRTKWSLLKPPDQKVVVQTAQSKQIKNYKGKREKSYAEGDSVVVKNYSDTNTSKWEDARVIKILGPRNYLVKLQSGRILKRHLDQIRDGVDDIGENGGVSEKSEGNVSPETDVDRRLLTNMSIPMRKRDVDGGIIIRDNLNEVTNNSGIMEGGISDNDSSEFGGFNDSDNQKETVVNQDSENVESNGNVDSVGSSVRRSVRQINRPSRYRK